MEKILNKHSYINHLKDEYNKNISYDNKIYIFKKIDFLKRKIKNK
jgi:hypothetical protein